MKTIDNIFWFRAALVLLALVMTLPAGAAIPDQLNIQGLLTTVSGAPAVQAGARSVQFLFYDKADANTELFSLTENVSIDKNGLFSQALTISSENLKKLNYFTAPIWVKIVLDDDNGYSLRFPQSPPWRPLRSVPYAITTRSLVDGVISAEGGNWPAVQARNTNPIATVAPAVVQVGSDWFPVGAIAGLATGGITGISGMSYKGFGVYGSSLSDSAYLAAGVGGLCQGNSPGVWGASLGAAGIGVRGGAVKVGGAFSGTNGHGLWGGSTNGTGVSGKGVVSGGSFECTSSTGIALYANGPETALKISNGNITIPREETHYFGIENGYGDDLTTDKMTGLIYVYGKPASTGVYSASVTMNIPSVTTHSFVIILDSPAADGLSSIDVYDGKVILGFRKHGQTVGLACYCGAAFQIVDTYF